MTIFRTGNLILIEELGGFRHILDGHALHAGDVLEFFDENRMTWTFARFEVILGKLGRRAYSAPPTTQRSRLTAASASAGPRSRRFDIYCRPTTTDIKDETRRVQPP